MTRTQGNVLILENSFDMGGSEKKLFDYIARSDRDRFGIKICCLKSGGFFKGRLLDLGVPFYDGLLHHRFDAMAFRRLASIIEKEDIDIIYTFSHPNTVMFSYLARARGLIKGFLVSYHAMGNPAGGSLVPRYLRPFLDSADVLLAVAEMHKRYLVDMEGLPESMIRVIHNGVDTDKYRPPKVSERATMRRELGLDDADVVMTTIASLKPAKCIDGLLRAVAPLVRGDGNVRVLLAGDGPDAAALWALAANLSIGDRVQFLGMRDDVDTILRASDVLVLPSRMGTETFPNVILEAMATGLPVVATDVGSVHEMVEDGASAFVVPTRDETALHGALARLAGDADLRQKFGSRGREIVEERFGIERMCAARDALFAALLSRNGAQ